MGAGGKEEVAGWVEEPRGKDVGTSLDELAEILLGYSSQMRINLKGIWLLRTVIDSNGDTAVMKTIADYFALFPRVIDGWNDSLYEFRQIDDCRRRDLSDIGRIRTGISLAIDGEYARNRPRHREHERVTGENVSRASWRQCDGVARHCPVVTWLNIKLP